MLYLKRLSPYDGVSVFKMLKGIHAVENSFTNPSYDMTYSEFRNWLIQQDHWSKGEMLPAGFVAQTTLWLYDEETPVGIGKIRHALTESSRENGGNIGYAISSQYRHKGYGKNILKMLLEEAHNMGIDEILLSVDKDNLPSKKICEENGGIIIRENSERFIFSF